VTALVRRFSFLLLRFGAGRFFPVFAIVVLAVVVLFALLLATLGHS
jgi:hypothetical protein